jgi:hypothetical protein
MARPLIYLPSEESYRTPGPLYRLGDPGAGSLRIEIDDERGRYLRAKRAESGLWDSLESRASLETRLSDWLAAAIQRDQPGLVTGSMTLDERVGAIQEDVVLMQRAEGSAANRARAVYVNVSFPSGWCPACTPGKTFLSIHSPVPVHGEFDGPGRVAAAEALFAAGDKVRFVWTLTPDDILSRQQCHREPSLGPAHESAVSSWRSATDVHLRVERQVIAPIDPNTACFFIRIYQYNLQTLDAGVRARLRSCVRGMPQNVARYKGFADDVERILNLI